MRKIKTNGSTVVIVARDEHTKNELDIFLNSTNSYIVSSYHIRFYILNVVNGSDKIWDTPSIELSDEYDGYISFFGEEIEYKVGLAHEPPDINKKYLDMLVLQFSKIRIDTHGSKVVHSVIQSPTEQINTDIAEIKIPLVTQSYFGTFTEIKINAINGNNDPILKFRVGGEERGFDKEFSTRTSILQSIFNDLIRLGYSKVDIEEIVKNYNLIISTSKDWQFETYYERAMTYIAFSNHSDIIHELYRTVKFYNNTDERVYQYILAMSLSKFTLSPILVKQNIRSEASVVAWKTLQASLDRLSLSNLVKLKPYYKKYENNSYVIYNYTIIKNPSIKSVVHYIDKDSDFPMIIYPDIKTESHLKNGLSSSYKVMIALLDGESQPSTLSNVLNISVGMINKHLHKLLTLGIVYKYKRGRKVFYNLTDNFVEQLPPIYIREIKRVNDNIEMEKESLNIMLTEYERELDLRDHVGHAKYDMLELHRTHKRMDRFKAVKNFTQFT